MTERWRVPSFIVTLGMLSMARGASQVISDNSTINGLPKGFIDFGNMILVRRSSRSIFLIALSTVLIGWFVLRFTIFGRFIYAIGNNEEAVRLSGHDPAPYKVATFVICGVLAGLAGLTFLLRLNVGSPIAGIGYELTAIAAVIIGGTSFTGGKGSVIGTFFGVCLLQVLSTGLQLMGVEDNFKTIIIGLVVVLAAVFDTYRSRIIARDAHRLRGGGASPRRNRFRRPGGGSIVRPDWIQVRTAEADSRERTCPVTRGRSRSTPARGRAAG